jgi:hypothetical protein
MKDLARIWEPIYDSRLEWRNKAIQEYINTIQDEEIQNIVKNSMSGSIPVSLYGKSQVGKTTFLLKLLGIRQEYLTKIHTILRCGSKKGLSATPTAMVYCKSVDENFKVYYEDQVKTFQSEDELSDELIALRKSIEQKRYTLLEEVRVEIPARYFNDETITNIQVCDLPGINSSNLDERNHVEKILKKFIPISSMILVFQIGNDINDVGNLFNNEIMKDIVGWKDSPQKYRLIITRAFSASSITSKKMFSNIIEGESAILKLYREEANFDLNNPNNLPESIKIFPFELGESKGDLPNQYSVEEQKNIEQIMEKFWDEIQLDIKLTAENGNTVQRILSYKPLIQPKINEYQELLRSLVAEKEHFCKKHIAIQETREEQNSDLSEALKNIDDEICELKNLNLMENVRFYPGAQVRDEMLAFIKTIEDGLIEEIEKIASTLKNGDGGFSILVDIKIDITMQSNAEMVRLGKIIRNSGFLGPSRDDVSKLNNFCNEINNLICTNYNPKIDQWRMYKLNILESKKRKIEDELKRKSKWINDKIESVSQQTILYNERIQLLEKKIKVLYEDLEQKNDIIELMNRSLNAETEIILKNNTDNQSIKQFLNLMKIALLNRELNRHLILGENHNG